jgi:hypothetical protein
VLRFDGLDDTAPTIVADLHRSVSNFSERGMLGMAIDPGYNRARRATRTVRLTR